MLVDEIKKENEDLSKKLKVLKEEKEMLKSKPTICDVSCTTQDGLFSCCVS